MWLALRSRVDHVVVCTLGLKRGHEKKSVLVIETLSSSHETQPLPQIFYTEAWEKKDKYGKCLSLESY